jgi:hypothetical protein
MGTLKSNPTAIADNCLVEIVMVNRRKGWSYPIPTQTPKLTGGFYLSQESLLGRIQLSKTRTIYDPEEPKHNFYE